MERILLEKAFRIFSREGVEAHSEQELSDRLNLTPAAFAGMFQSLEGMLQQIARYDLEEQEKEVERLLSSARNAAEEVTILMLTGLSRLKNYHPEYFMQLRRIYPSVWEIYSRHTQHYTYYKVYEVLNKGILSNIFRKDINLELVTKIVIAQLGLLLNPSLFPPSRYNLAEVFRSIYLYYTRGICTEQGAKLAEAYFAKTSI